MKLDLRKVCKTLFLCIASVNLGVSSGLELFGILLALLFAYLHYREWKKPDAVPRYRKSVAYLSVIPFAVWWVMVPSVEYGVSPYVVYIPAWYLLLLAWLQKRSVGNGGFEAFVAFNGCAVLLLGLYNAPRFCVALGVVGILLALQAYARPRTAVYKHLLFVLLFAAMGCAAYGGWQYWKHHRGDGGRWAQDYYDRTRVMGFNPVVSLGSFRNNYVSRYNNQVVLRVWDPLAPAYLRAAVYEKYVGGIWKLPRAPAATLYPSYYRVDYAVFESADSATRSLDSVPVWVRASLDNMGFFFAPFGASGIAVKNADSLDYYSTGVFVGANEKRGDWYYFRPGALAAPEVAGVPDSTYLQIGRQYGAFLDSVSRQMDLDGYEGASVLKQISGYFVRHFRYSLQVPGMLARHRSADPLVLFWNAKQGYCEYFATLATLLLRHQGIPARYVTGFARPERSASRPYAVYRRSGSHAWVEAFVDSSWVQFDPTPPLFAVARPQPSWLAERWEGLVGRLNFFLHVVREGEWRRAVDSLQLDLEDFLTGKFYAALLLLAAVAAAVGRFRRKKQSQLPESRRNVQKWIAVLDRAERRLSRLGFTRMPGETVGAFVERLSRKSRDEHLQDGRLRDKRPHDEQKYAEALKDLREYESVRWK